MRAWHITTINSCNRKQSIQNSGQNAETPERTNMRIQALILIGFLGVLCISVRGQGASGGGHSTPSSQLSGKVIDIHGKAARGAIVTLRDNVTAEDMTATADKYGKYLFAKVVPGDYSLSGSRRPNHTGSRCSIPVPLPR